MIKNIVYITTYHHIKRSARTHISYYVTPCINIYSYILIREYKLMINYKNIIIHTLLTREENCNISPPPPSLQTSSIPSSSLF